jgi:hypothetical protein
MPSRRSRRKRPPCASNPPPPFELAASANRSPFGGTPSSWTTRPSATTARAPSGPLLGHSRVLHAAHQPDRRRQVGEPHRRQTPLDRRSKRCRRRRSWSGRPAPLRGHRGVLDPLHGNRPVHHIQHPPQPSVGVAGEVLQHCDIDIDGPGSCCIGSGSADIVSGSVPGRHRRGSRPISGRHRRGSGPVPGRHGRGSRTPCPDHAQHRNGGDQAGSAHHRHAHNQLSAAHRSLHPHDAAPSSAARPLNRVMTSDEQETALVLDPIRFRNTLVPGCFTNP